MKKILYLMNVDWNWIKQRPHFLAEQLGRYYDITIVNQHRYTKKGFQKRKHSGNYFSFKVIPRIDRYPFLREINLILKKRIIKKLIVYKMPDYIWVTNPDQINWLPKDWLQGRLIYDCMDDHYGLSTSEKKKKDILVNEKNLCKYSKWIFVSSSYLADTLKRRYGEDLSSKITIVRNGYDGIFKDLKQDNKKTTDNDKHSAAYFGTIAEWFDFEIIQKSLDAVEGLEYRLIGPTAHGVIIPKDKRIQYIGTVEHEDLYESIKDVDCLIMPFKLNESIKAVDPVKLYEYISYGKDIITVRYDEIERFAPFVYFYEHDDVESYIQCIDCVRKQVNVKYTDGMRKKFLEDASWSKRAKQVVNVLDGLL